ncbi:hypothetical protein J3R30DRAFT_1144563 [Lentinula aciculospora]|uniref:Uncharacterized protein n=1 Tax=Lentinula aciculospora TaxID=153920 RepID=A0A9W9DHI8_9AGAR|nr:hypothetical protein J3R30DRAFT_1144563 [Lentinula aciculospora]
MRLNLATYFVISLVSFAYAAPVPREATMTSLKVRSDEKVIQVRITFDRNGLLGIITTNKAEEMMRTAIKDKMQGKFGEPPDYGFKFTEGTTEEKGRAEFTFDTEKNGDTKTYKGGRLVIDTNAMYVKKLHS